MSNDVSPLLWQPDPQTAGALAMAAFSAQASKRAGRDLSAYDALHAWSVEERGAFWNLVWDWCGVIGEKGAQTLLDAGSMLGDRFFPQARLNYAENLLAGMAPGAALIFRSETGLERVIDADALRDTVCRLQKAFLELGLKAGDRIAAMVPNTPETVALMLAAASIGATWSSCSPDFGTAGVLDRFGQIAPALFIACDGYSYNGKWQATAAKAQAVAEALAVRHALLVPYDGAKLREEAKGFLSYGALLDGRSGGTPAFTRLPFNHPLFILYSSGTTGAPKCIVHGAGGTLLQHVKEHRLHTDIRRGDRLFYFSTCGWMMWNWLVSGLASGAALVLFDGSPFHPDGSQLYDLAAKAGVTCFGGSAKFYDASRKAGLTPGRTHDLSRLRSICSTGSPLAPENFRFLHEEVSASAHIASISGGTDIVSCFVLGHPGLPVRIGEIQVAGLGMAVGIRDEAGGPLEFGKGELVCTKAFPSMPVGFWNDPDGAKYKKAYFERFEDVWCHGDFAERRPGGGIVIHGRSDATLNPGGVRIGTAEIYNVVERMPEIAEAVCIGQERDGDVRVVLFVRMSAGVALDEALSGMIRKRIREEASPRHVPAVICAVADIPRTKSGKITELAIRDVVHGRAVSNANALANPEALEHFRNRAELA